MHSRGSGVRRRNRQAAPVPVVPRQHCAAGSAASALVLRDKFAQILSRELELRRAGLAAIF